jgi:hypothetical protein
MKLTTHLYEYFDDKIFPFFNRKATELGYVAQQSQSRILFTITGTLIVFVTLILIPAAIYSRIEGWAYIDAFYYCFISLLTVGLGDYVPGDSQSQSNRHLYKIFSTLYLLFGVLVVFWLVEIYSETPEFNFYRYVTRMPENILFRHLNKVHKTNTSTLEPTSSIDSSKIQDQTTNQKVFNENESIPTDNNNTGITEH